MTWIASLGLNEAVTTAKNKARRKPISYRCSSDNKTIDGLYKCPDGRRKVVATGFRFTESDERLAIAKCFDLTATASAANAILIESINPKKYGREVARHVEQLPSKTVLSMNRNSGRG
jgi:hypothetical protein